MSRLDVYHDAVRHALEKDGWTITHDPLTLSVGGRDIYIDLGAEMPIAAEKEGRRIAVEVKSFLMDRNDEYRAIVKRTVQEVADMTPSDENIRTEFVCDETLGHYQLGQVGWQNKRRVDE